MLLIVIHYNSESLGGKTWLFASKTY